VATADAVGGHPYLVPLSFVWDGSTILVATPASSPTSRNLQATGRVRLAMGPTRDVILIEGTARAIPVAGISEEEARNFADKTGFDPRLEREVYLYFRIQPQRIQAWRESNELAGRDLMRDCQWLV
jgi:nitroimidazol reductase NimA-like FMN-containing flavoprotein (pyridoxamine 5'-phosphate oxidase superfamily)